MIKCDYSWNNHTSKCKKNKEHKNKNPKRDLFLQQIKFSSNLSKDISRAVTEQQQLSKKQHRFVNEKKLFYYLKTCDKTRLKGLFERPLICFC